MRIATVTIRLRNPAVLVVDAQFRSLALADPPSRFDGILFEIVVRACSHGTAAFHVPSATGVRDYMMGFGSFSGHVILLLCQWQN
jgi:hypothetical protein